MVPLLFLSLGVMSGDAWAQSAQEPAQPVEDAVEEELAGEDMAAPETASYEQQAQPLGQTGLRLHFVSTRNTYAQVGYDIFSVSTRAVVGSGTGAMESRGEQAQVWELEPGLYKIVRSGEPFETRVDFATAMVAAGSITDFVIVVDPDTLQFRGSGPVTGELPQGTTIAGIRVNLNAGGNLMLNQKVSPVGTTSGTTALIGLFGNFGLVFDRGNHFLNIGSELQLNLHDPVTGSSVATSDRFEASALYAYNINNPYVGPYVRAGFRTRVFPGYLYFESDQAMGTVTINRLNGGPETVTFGGQASPDDLRLKVSEPFGPFILQEEIGANLKAVDLDLLLLKLVVATRAGFGFRQGFTNGLLVAEGSDRGSSIILNEVDDYMTLGPVVGANASVSFARWLFGSAQFGMLIPVTNRDRAGEDFGGRLLLDLSGTAGFKVPILTSLLFASFDYTFRLERDGFLTSATQFEQNVMARVNVTLF